jgi:IMP cyclohydrolase
MVLLALDYEKDAYSTPRIAAVVPINGEIAWMGIVRHDALLVREVQLSAGKAIYLATYEVNSIDDNLSTEFDASTAADAARFIIDGGVFSTFEHPVTGGAALAGSHNFHLGSYSV